jgi:hypothetical protein
MPGVKRRSYAQAVAEVVFGFLFLIWLLLIPQHPFLLLGPGVAYMHVAPYELAPVWSQFYWWIVALNVLQLLWHGFDLLRGKWQKPNPAQHIVFKAVGLVAILPLVISPGHVLFVLKHPEMDTWQYGGTLHSINEGVHMAMTVAAVVVALQLIFHIAQVGLESCRRRVAASH